MANDFRPTSRRQRLLIVAATAAVVVIFWLLLVFQPGREPRRWAAPPPAACAPGQTRDCVGGTAEVRLIGPAATPASGIRASAPR